uniref:Uncharacterized protein n=1 Tax=Anopheles atroparvus TaxID=41427 RepID=A0AAG5DPS8_ANOAO
IRLDRLSPSLIRSPLQANCCGRVLRRGECHSRVLALSDTRRCVRAGHRHSGRRSTVRLTSVGRLVGCRSIVLDRSLEFDPRQRPVREVAKAGRVNFNLYL